MDNKTILNKVSEIENDACFRHHNITDFYSRACGNCREYRQKAQCSVAQDI